MTDTATAPSKLEPPRPSPARKLAGPPGVLFCVATIGAILIAVEANTRQSLWLLLVTVLAWFCLAGVWAFRLLIALLERRGRMSLGHWARWLSIPLVLGLVYGVTRTDVLIRGRFDLSRGALDEMARDIEAGGSLERGWTGLYDVATAERIGNGFWFVIDDSWFGRWGYAYAPDGVPTESEDTESPLWTGASFEHVDGPWWTFQQEWD